ncbi:MAG: hypothetical protein IE881_05510 [Epsilonproteobacteria bacterium]|nr:hypothetical protein [Campylobacterota bacterium]
MQDISVMTDEEFEKHIEAKTFTTTNEDTNVDVESEDIDTKVDEQETNVIEDDIEEKESQEVEDTDKPNNTDKVNETNDNASSIDNKEEIDYKAFYEQVTAPYKANGKMMPGLKNPEDFRTALSMASNYALKTTALKPHLGRIRALEKAGVTDDEFNEMMEFRNKNPEVIKKALKEAGIDPLDIDTEATIDYRPQNHIVSQRELAFEEAIASIKDTPEFEFTAKVVTEVWDEESRNAMLDNPNLIRGLNEEIQMGRFDTIQAMIEQRKMLGKTNGMSDLAMYQEIATAMNAMGTSQNTQKPSPVQKVQDPAINEQKKKAGISTKKISPAVKKYDPAKLSDEEFMELINSGAKFI